MASLGEAVVEVGADTSRFRAQTQAGVNAALASASATMQKVGGGMTAVGRKLTLGVTAPLLGIAYASVKTAGQFESTMNVLQAKDRKSVV